MLSGDFLEFGPQRMPTDKASRTEAYNQKTKQARKQASISKSRQKHQDQVHKDLGYWKKQTQKISVFNVFQEIKENESLKKIDLK